VKYAFVRENHRRWPVGVMCRVLLVSRSGYYGWRNRPASRRRQRREALVAKIRIAHQENRQLYGSPRIHRALLIDGESVSRNTVAKLMREANIRAKQRRSVRQRRLPASSGDPRHYREHERPRRLLGQRDDGELLGDAQDGTDPSPELCDTRRGKTIDL